MSRSLAGRWHVRRTNRQQHIVHWIVRLLAVLAGLIVLLVATGAVRSADSPRDSDLAAAKAYIDAGEFAPVLVLAQSPSVSAKDRDAILAQTAKAQASSGDRAAAITSAAGIDDDRVLADTLAQVRSPTAYGAGNSGSNNRTADPTGIQSAKASGRMGGNQADFDPLIDLITSTVDPTTWDNTGGNGSVMPFPGGVSIDAEGVLRPVMKEDRTSGLEKLRRLAAQAQNGNDDAHQTSGLRKVSLTRLERQIELLAALGQRPTPEMQTLAGLQRIKYVLVYPEQGEIVLAGPAGDWQLGPEGRLVGKQSGRPVLRLDDFVVILRHMLGSADARFGCSITPTQASLADVKDFVAESNKTPLKPGQRDTWLRQLREKLGQQEIEYYGIDPRTRAGLVMVEADYRMKLVGMGLEEGVLGVQSYLD